MEEINSKEPEITNLGQASLEFEYILQGSLTVWALYAYFSDSQNAAFELLVWCM